MVRLSTRILMLAAALCAGTPADAANLAHETVVVCNRNDPDSARIAMYYAAKRGIPVERVVQLDAPVTEEITRDDYQRTIAAPLSEKFQQEGWWTVSRGAEGRPVVTATQIRVLALVRGVPLKIAQDIAIPGDEPTGPEVIARTNAASVDSELAALGLFRSIVSGAVENPFFRRFTRAWELDVPWLLLVARLDAPAPETVLRMIDDSIGAEKTGLKGFCYADARGIETEGLKAGDDWIKAAAVDVRKWGMPVILDMSEPQFPPGYPMGYPALYYGWYSANIGPPFTDKDFRFLKGAVACHLHSFSAATLRDPNAGWAGPLIERGAAATTGNVYEPYLAMTPHFDIMQARLTRGMTFAEAGWAAQPALSWMTVFVGDPLYRPFAAWNDLAAEDAPDDWAAYRQSVLAWTSQGRTVGERMLREYASEMDSGVLWEGLGLIMAGVKEWKSAFAAFEKAGAAYLSKRDQIRCALHEINILRGLGRKNEALSMTRKFIKSHGDAFWARALRDIELELDPPPPPPTPSPEVSPSPSL